MVELFGILNLTEDSFSDGGDFLEAESAIKQADSLSQGGADCIEISGQSSNISASLGSEEEEWRRILTVLPYLQERKVKMSVDSFRPNVQALALKNGVHMINDISGFTHPDSKKLLQEELIGKANVSLVIMHSHTHGMAKAKSMLTPGNIIPSILSFLRDRKKELLSWGISEDRLCFDPGMGFFLGDDPELSFTVLRNIDQFLVEFPRLMVSVSRKSFLGNVLGGRQPLDRENATLAAEIFLLQKKIPMIRTHNVRKVREAEKILSFL